MRVRSSRARLFRGVFTSLVRSISVRSSPPITINVSSLKKSSTRFTLPASPHSFSSATSGFHSPARAVAEIVFDLIAKVVQVHHDLVEAVLLQQLDKVFHNRACKNWDGASERCVSGGPAGSRRPGKDHRFH